MKPTLIAAILQGGVALVQEIPALADIFRNMIDATESGSGPTPEQISAAVAQVIANDAAIQKA